MAGWTSDVTECALLSPGLPTTDYDDKRFLIDNFLTVKNFHRYLCFNTGSGPDEVSERLVASEQKSTIQRYLIIMEDEEIRKIFTNEDIVTEVVCEYSSCWNTFWKAATEPKLELVASAGLTRLSQRPDVSAGYVAAYICNVLIFQCCHHLTCWQWPGAPESALSDITDYLLKPLQLLQLPLQLLPMLMMCHTWTIVIVP